MSYLGGEFLMELMLSQGSLLTSRYIFMSYFGGALLMEVMLSKGCILTSCTIIMAFGEVSSLRKSCLRKPY